VAQALIDHDRIREWAEARGGAPASVRGTGSSGDPGLLRIDMPGGAGNESLQRISWDDWFRKFEAQQLALLIDDDDRPATFNKLVYRHDVNIDINPATRRRGGESKESTMAKSDRRAERSPAAAGRTDDPDTGRDEPRDADADDADVDDVDETDDEIDDSDDEFDDADSDDEDDGDDDLGDDDLGDDGDESDEDEKKDDDRG
jgi:hypothetical protein